MKKVKAASINFTEFHSVTGLDRDEYEKFKIHRRHRYGGCVPTYTDWIRIHQYEKAARERKQREREAARQQQTELRCCVRSRVDVSGWTDTELYELKTQINDERKARWTREKELLESAQRPYWEAMMTNDVAVDAFLQKHQYYNRHKQTPPWVRRHIYPGEIPSECDFLSAYELAQYPITRFPDIPSWVQSDPRRPVFMRGAMEILLDNNRQYFVKIARRFLQRMGYTQTDDDTHREILKNLNNRIHKQWRDCEVYRRRNIEEVTFSSVNGWNHSKRWLLGKLVEISLPPEPEEPIPPQRSRVIDLRNAKIAQAVRGLGLLGPQQEEE